MKITHSQQNEVDILYARCHTSRKINVETRRGRNSLAFPNKNTKFTAQIFKKLVKRLNIFA